ncbi:MAG: hypothetical protein QM817_40880 [Archangium sp.]
MSLWDLIERPLPTTPEETKRFEVEGPWNWGDPVHETMTRLALNKAGVVDWNLESTDPKVFEYLRGVFWNDDPEALLFNDSGSSTSRFSTGLQFAIAFKAAETESKNRFHQKGAVLTARSHFGDLQFLHAMATRDGQDPVQTLASVMGWARFAWEVSTGKIGAEATMEALPDESVRDLFDDKPKRTVKELFNCGKAGIVRRRALGSLLHMVQDSYASGHVEREELADERKGRVRCFYSYAGQDHAKHAADDGWRQGATDLQKIASIKGGRDALEQCTVLAKLYVDNAPWAEVEAHLRGTVFSLSPELRVSGPGSAFE